MARILLAHAHELVRMGIRALLGGSAAHQICGEAAGLDAALQLAGASGPDVAVLGELVAGGDALGNVRAVRNAGARSVLVLAADGTRAAADRALGHGAGGCVLLSDSSAELLDAISAVAGGARYLSRALRAEPAPGAAGPALTRREQQVLRLVAGGRRTPEIAVMLEISEKTVEAHRGAIMRKLGLHRLADVVRYAVANALCGP